MRACAHCLQVLEQERQQLRAAAMDVAEFRAQQQALVQQEQQKRRGLHQQLQQAAQQLQQAQQQLEEMQQLKDEVQLLKQQHATALQQTEQQHAAEMQQLSERLTEAVNQKQVCICKVHSFECLHECLPLLAAHACALNCRLKSTDTMQGGFVLQQQPVCAF